MIARMREIALLLAVLSVLIAATHFWLTDRLGVLRVIYPLQAAVSELSISCSERAPAWMKGVLVHANRHHYSAANQLAYISQSGEEFHCENGWLDDWPWTGSVTKQTRFRYASLTKLLTAQKIVDLVNHGKLQLDATLVSIFPELENASLNDSRVKNIKIRHLLNHTAGFDRLKTPDPLMEHYSEPWCYYHPESISKLELDFSPGEKVSYSNVGYCLLGEIIRVVENRSFRDAIEESFMLESSGIRFVNGSYYPDEPRYDFRNSDFYGESYYKYFDFRALSSSAGLSGSALSLARLIKKHSKGEGVGLASPIYMEGCELDVFRGCYGVSLYHYKKPGGALVLYQEGFLPGSTSLLAMSELGDVLVLLSSGAPYDIHKDGPELYSKIYGILSENHK